MADRPQLVVGPLLRYADAHEATVWVEADRACTVEVLGTTAGTFQVAGHHYALVHITGLEPGCAHEYGVALDGEEVWPPPGERRGVLRTPAPQERFLLAFGSCRVALPHEPPYTLTKDQDPGGREVDALAALQRRMQATDPEHWPDALLLIGDQVYADEVTPSIKERMRARDVDRRGAGEQIADFEEYTWLYRDSWQDPAVRWLLASVPSAMVFDDHDVHDDWNTSGAWVRDMRAKPWWHERIVGAYMSYWVYQHLGNLSPGQLEEDEVWQAVQDDAEDATGVLRTFAEQAERDVSRTQWSFRRDFGTTRLVVLDTRAGRIVEDDTRRRMLDPEEWAWVSENLTGDVDHLIVAASLPLLLAPALHHGEAWNEAVCAGAWGKTAAKAGEKVRQALDLEHWSAFGHCFDRLVDELRAVGAGERGAPPASIVVLGGDVHHAYLAEAGYPRDAGVRSAVVQAVCSPLRNPLAGKERRVLGLAHSRPMAVMMRALARAAKVPPPAIRWRFPEPPTFDNQVATVAIRGRSCRVTIERTLPEEWERPELHVSLDRVVA